MTTFINLPEDQGLTPITTKQDLIAYFMAGCKPRNQWRIGMEYEQFIVYPETLLPVPYHGDRGIAALLKEFIQYGWQPSEENGHIIGLKRGLAAITTEPGGQLELSGTPLATLHEIAAELDGYTKELISILKKLNLTSLPDGFHPYATRADFPWMPKKRYDIMRAYMPTKGDLGIDMMLRTCGIQTNLDFADEQDMVQKMRIAMALQPIAMALFANSSMVEGRPSGYASFRAQVWLDTDPDRSGLLAFVFDPDVSFDRYVDYALQVPMYLMIRDGETLDVAGCSFYDFMQGKLPNYPGLLPTMADWVLHLTTLFPDVRLKQYLEMRGADGGKADMIMALQALWVGLLYDQENVDLLSDIIKSWSIDDLLRLRTLVPLTGLETQSGELNTKDIADYILYQAQQGLERRGHGEAIYLEPLLSAITSNAKLKK